MFKEAKIAQSQTLDQKDKPVGMNSDIDILNNNSNDYEGVVKFDASPQRNDQKPSKIHVASQSINFTHTSLTVSQTMSIKLDEEPKKK